MNAWMGTLCPGLCVAVPHHQLCLQGREWILVRVRAAAAHAHSLNLTVMLCWSLCFLFFFQQDQKQSSGPFFFLGKVIRVLFYTVLKKYNFLLFELKVTTQHSKPALSSTYSRLRHEQTATLRGSELDAPAEALLPPNRRQQHAR